MSNASMVSALVEWVGKAVIDLEWVPETNFADDLPKRSIAVAHPDSVEIFELSNRTPTQVLLPDALDVIDIAFSPDGSWLIAGSRQPTASAGFKSSLEGWRRSNSNGTGQDWGPVGVINQRTGPGFTALTFTPDGSMLVAAYTSSEPLQQGLVNIWRVSTWEIQEMMETGTVLEIAVSGESTLLATTPQRYQINVWDMLEGGLRYQPFTSFTGAVSSLVFSPDSLVMATGHYDGTIRLWNTITGQVFLTLPTVGIISSLAFSPDGTVLASGDGDRKNDILLWSTSTGDLLRELPGHSHAVDNLLFSPDGQILVSSSYDGTVRVWGIVP